MLTFPLYMSAIGKYMPALYFYMLAIGKYGRSL